MNRRAFLKSMGFAAPMIFIPKLITVRWKTLTSIFDYRGDSQIVFRDVTDKIFHYAPNYSPLLMLKGGVLPGHSISPKIIGHLKHGTKNKMP